MFRPLNMAHGRSIGKVLEVKFGRSWKPRKVVFKLYYYNLHLFLVTSFRLLVNHSHRPVHTELRQQATTTPLRHTTASPRLLRVSGMHHKYLLKRYTLWCFHYAHIGLAKNVCYLYFL